MGKKGNPDFKKLNAAKKKIEAKKKQKVKVNTKKIALTANTTAILADPEKVKNLVKHYQKDAQVLQALNETKSFFQDCVQPAQYLIIIYQEMFSIITHEKLEVRKKLKEVLQYLVNKFDSAPLLSNLPTIITYVCSGLTHLSKNIRFTTLEIFSVIQEKIPDAVFDYFSKIFPLLITLLNEKSILDAVSADAARSSGTRILQHPSSSSTAVSNSKSKDSSRPKFIFHLLLSILRSMGLHRKEGQGNVNEKVVQKGSNFIRPVVFLGSKLQWICALATTTNHSYQPEQSIEDLISLFLHHLQQIIIDFVGSSGKSLTNSFVQLFTQLFTTLSEFMERYTFCLDKIHVYSSLVNVFPFLLKDEEQNELSFMKLKVLNLKIAQILSKLKETASDNKQAVIKCKQYVYSALEDIQLSEVMKAGEVKLDLEENVEEMEVVSPQEIGVKSEEIAGIRKQLYHGIFANLTNHLEHLEDIRRIIQRLNMFLQSLLLQSSSVMNARATVDTHLLGTLNVTVKEVVIRGLLFPESELIGFISSLLTLTSAIIVLSLQSNKSPIISHFNEWILLLREMLLRMGDLWEKDFEQTIHHQHIEAFRSHLLEVFRALEPNNPSYRYSFSTQSQSYQLSWINLLYYIPKPIFSSLIEFLIENSSENYTKAVQEQLHFVVQSRKH